MIRPARPDDLVALAEIERAVGAAFARLGMQAVADDEPLRTHAGRRAQPRADRAPGEPLRAQLRSEAPVRSRARAYAGRRHSHKRFASAAEGDAPR